MADKKKKKKKKVFDPNKHPHSVPVRSKQLVERTKAMDRLLKEMK